MKSYKYRGDDFVNIAIVTDDFVFDISRFSALNVSSVNKMMRKP